MTLEFPAMAVPFWRSPVALTKKNSSSSSSASLSHRIGTMIRNDVDPLGRNVWVPLRDVYSLPAVAVAAAPQTLLLVATSRLEPEQRRRRLGHLVAAVRVRQTLSYPRRLGREQRYRQPGDAAHRAAHAADLQVAVPRVHRQLHDRLDPGLIEQFRGRRHVGLGVARRFERVERVGQYP